MTNLLSLFNRSSLYITSLFLFVLYGHALSVEPLHNVENWNVLQDKKIWIGWAEEDDVPWCKAQTTFPFSMNKITKILEDKANYPNVFKRIEATTILEPEIVHIMLDMPFPITSRDYIVKYTTHFVDNDLCYQFRAVNHEKASPTKSYIRLVNAAGEWRLSPLKNNETQVTYTWNGELLGDFPNWALPRAWKTQGNEVLNWLLEATDKAINN